MNDEWEVPFLPQEIESMNDEIEETRYSNLEMCRKCGGWCCKRVPCALTPKQIVSLGYSITEESLEELIKTGNYSIIRIYGTVYFDARYIIRHRMWGCGIATQSDDFTIYHGVPAGKNPRECVMLTDKGCSLSFEHRGAEARSMIPDLSYTNDGHINHRCHGFIGTDEMTIVWDPYHSILRKLYVKYHEGNR